MTTALAPAGGLPGTLREDGYDLPPGLSFERWLSVGETLQQMERSVQWWLGDWWNYGERHYGEMASQASKDHVHDITGYAYSTVNKAGWVAREIEPVRRRTNLSWSHHAEVITLPETEQEALLDRAESAGMTRYDLRDAVRERKLELAGQAQTADGEPICLAEAPWVPQIEDLKPDVRASVEANAPGGRHRLGWIAGALWALVWNGAEDSFLSDRWRA